MSGSQSQFPGVMSMVLGLFLLLPVSTTQAEDTSNSSIVSRVNIEVTSHLGDRQQFIENDKISFLINLDQAVYLYAFYRDASGTVIQLMPGPVRVDHHFQPGFFIPFPADNSAFELVVQAPYGKEQLWVFGSDNGQLSFPGRDLGQGLKQIPLSRAQLAARIKTASQKRYGEARLDIHTRSR